MTGQPQQGALILFSKQDSVIQVSPSGQVTVDVKKVHDRASAMDMVKLARWYTEVRPCVFQAMQAVDEVVLYRMAERDQTRMPVVTEEGELTGRELVLKDSSPGHDVDEDLLAEAQRVIRKEGVNVTLLEKEKSLVLDAETLQAFGITEEALKQYQDKIRITTKRSDIRSLKKIAQMGGVGGDLIRRAITKKQGRVRIYVDGDEKDAPMEEDPAALGGEL